MTLKPAFATFFIKRQTSFMCFCFPRSKINTFPSSLLTFSWHTSLSLSWFAWIFQYSSVFSTNPLASSAIASFYSSLSSFMTFSASPLSRFYISLLILKTFPFLTICFGSLFKNSSLDGGLKSLFQFDSNVFMASSELSFSYFSAILSTILRKIPLGYFAFRTYGKYPSIRSPSICRDSLDWQGKNLYPLMAIPFEKNPIGSPSAFLNLCTPFQWYISVPNPSECRPALSSYARLMMVFMSISLGSLY